MHAKVSVLNFYNIHVNMLPADDALFCMMSAETGGSHVSHEQSETEIGFILHLTYLDQLTRMATNN